MSGLANINKALSNNVGHFNMATAAVDAITIKLEKDSLFQKLVPMLTYISRPLDFIIQIIATPIFAAYQTGKKIGEDFKKSVCKGFVSLSFSPVIFAWKILINGVSTSFVSTPLNIIIPLQTIDDMRQPITRSVQRMVKMHEKYSFMFANSPHVQAFEIQKIVNKIVAIVRHDQENFITLRQNKNVQLSSRAADLVGEYSPPPRDDEKKQSLEKKKQQLIKEIQELYVEESPLVTLLSKQQILDCLNGLQILPVSLQ